MRYRHWGEEKPGENNLLHLFLIPFSAFNYAEAQTRVIVFFFGGYDFSLGGKYKMKIGIFMCEIVHISGVI